MTELTQPVWLIGPISTPTLIWGEHRKGQPHVCKTCGIELLTGEESGFCCGPNGSRYYDVPPLPPLPPEIETIATHPQISTLSRILNLIFSFASLETTHAFPEFAGPPGFFAIQGHVYHRIRPTHHNSATRWLLFDGFIGNMPYSNLATSLPTDWIPSVRHALLSVNPFVRNLQQLSLLSPAECPTAELVLLDSGHEIAAIMSMNNTARTELNPRRLVISRLNGHTQTIPTISRLWEPLAYPLFFPHGTLGWGLVNNDAATTYSQSSLNEDREGPPTTQMWHYRARLLRESRFRIFGRLANEYTVDMFSRDLECRLSYIRQNQLRIRKEDVELMEYADTQPSENIYLPSSFLGSKRWVSNQIADSLAIAAALGNPTFFVTMTCNTQWPEIQSRLLPGQTFTDVPVVVARVFKRKLTLLLKALKTMFINAGKQIYSIHSIEFQKRGLPHAHILVKYSSPCHNPNDIDSIVSAEMPSNPEDANLVQTFMLHHHPSLDRPLSKYCQQEFPDGSRKCRFGYPRPLQPTTTIDNEGRVHYRRRHQGDEMVVPHCLALLRKFRCHINFEVSGTSHIFQYLFKYIHKAPDSARYKLFQPNDNAENVDEIEEYWNARYLSAGEAVWRILGFHVTKKDPSVTLLPIHLPHTHSHHQYHRSDGKGSTLSLLDRYFIRPNGIFIDETGHQQNFDDITYNQYFSLFRLTKYDSTCHGSSFYERMSIAGSPQMLVVQRDHSRLHLCRLQPVRPSEGEIFYLRTILQHCPALSFENACTIGGEIYSTFQEAAIAMGLFADNNEAELAMQEAIITLKTPRQLRLLFVHLLVNDCVTAPLTLWNTYSSTMAMDHILQCGNNTDIGTTRALHDIMKLLEEFGRTPSDYGLPLPGNSTQSTEILHEILRWGFQIPTLSVRANTARFSMSHEQASIFDRIIDACINKEPLLAFIDGKAGRGKTYLVNALCNKLRSLGQIVLPTATAAFAAQLYAGGRTTHSMFKVPVNDKSEMLQSPITPTDPRGDLIRSASAIIWDEAPMANRAVLACVEEVCRNVMGNTNPFGGKIVILLGDFRQTCPVIRGGTRPEIIDASIKSSPLWPLFKVFCLHAPIRNAQDLELASFVDEIGDGAGPEVSLNMLPSVTNIENLIDFIYPPNIITDPIACLKRAILCPTNAQVDNYNHIVTSHVEGTQHTYLAADSLQEANDIGLIPPDSVLDYFASHTPPGLPSHSLTIKVNAIYRLIRNFSIDLALVKNSRVIVIDVGARLITVRILRELANGTSVDADDILIPRISFTHTLRSGHTLLRRQFPLSPAYATTFNSCQGLTLDRIGIDLTTPVFSHGQLYTAMSRIRH